MSAAGADVAPAVWGEPRAAGGFESVALADSGSIGTAWSALADRSAADNVFFGPDFAVPAMAHLGRGAVAIAVARSPAGASLAIAPYVRARLGRVAPAVRLWAHDYAPLGAPLLDTGDPVGALCALVGGLAPAGSGLSLVLPDIEASGVVAAALAAIARETGRPLTRLDAHVRAMLARGGAAADLRAGLRTGQRKELGRQMRRLGDLGSVAVETVVEADAVGARFEEFLAIELGGWKGRRGTALASQPASAAFAREAVFNLAAAGHARIHSLRIGGHPIAVLVSLTAGATACTWKIAYDEAYARYSPGVQLMLEAPRDLFADPAVMRIDSCAAADHPMIDRLWPGRLEVATFVLGPPGGGPLHAIGLAAARAEIAARANVRQLIRRH